MSIRFLSPYALQAWSAVAAVALLMWALLRTVPRILKITILALLAVALLIVLIGNIVFRGDRDIAYRFAAPDAPECSAQDSKPIVLSSNERSQDNDELAAIA